MRAGRGTRGGVPRRGAARRAIAARASGVAAAATLRPRRCAGEPQDHNQRKYRYNGTLYHVLILLKCFPVQATQILLLPRFVEHRAEVHSDSKRNRIQLKMYAAAVTQFEIESADRIHIQRRAETVVADQTGASRGFDGVLKHATVLHHPACTAGSRRHKPAENLLLAPGRDIEG